MRKYRTLRIQVLKDLKIKSKKEIYEATWFSPARFYLTKLFEHNNWVKCNFRLTNTYNTLQKLQELMIKKNYTTKPESAVWVSLYLVSNVSMATIHYEVIKDTTSFRHIVLAILRRTGLQKKTGKIKHRWLGTKRLEKPYDEYESIIDVRERWQKNLSN